MHIRSKACGPVLVLPFCHTSREYQGEAGVEVFVVACLAGLRRLLSGVSNATN